MSEMRSRQVIESTFNKAPRNESIIQNQKLILEVMLDIRTINITAESKVAGLLSFFKSAIGPDFNEIAFKTCQISELMAMHKMLDTPLAQVEQLSREIDDAPQRRKSNGSQTDDKKSSSSGNAMSPEKPIDDENPGPIFNNSEEEEPEPSPL